MYEHGTHLSRKYIYEKKKKQEKEKKKENEKNRRKRMRKTSIYFTAQQTGICNMKIYHICV